MLAYISGYKVLTSNLQQKYFPLGYNNELMRVDCKKIKCSECCLKGMICSSCIRNQKKVSQEKRIKLREIIIEW